MRKSTRKELVNKLLDAMFANVRHNCPVEREVFAPLFCVYFVYDAADVHLILLCCKFKS